MSNASGLSTVSELVKQKSLHNNQQYASAKQGLEFAETAIKSTMFTYTSQQTKLEKSFHQKILSKDEYDQQTDKLKKQYEIDRAPWDLYVKKLSELIEHYLPPRNESKRKKSISIEQISTKKKSTTTNTHLTFSSDESSDSDTPTPALSTTSKIVKYDSSTNTDPVEFSLRSPFPSTPNIIHFTAQTTQIIHRIPLQHINEIAAKQIVLLHDEGQLVRWNDVLWRILTYFQVQDLGHLGLQRADQIACIDNLIRTQNKINTYLDAYTYWQTLGTIHELELDLARIFSKVSFNELFLGPIEKQPKIDELFRLKFLRNEQIRKDLKSSDILKYLDQYMTKEYVWKNDKEIHLDNFLKFIAEKLQVKNIFQLGIRIKSVYLARNCIKALQANQRKTMEIARTELDQFLIELARNEVKKIRQLIENNLENDETNNLQLRKIYSTMEPLEIINDLIEICREICQSHSSFRKITNVLHAIRNDSMLTNIFQIAICHGQLKLPEQPMKKPEPINNNKKIYFDSSESEEEVLNESNKSLPNQSELFQAFQEQILCLKFLNFSLLARIEQRLCERFQVKFFHEFNQGNFNEYLEKHEEILVASNIQFQFSSLNSNCSTRFIPFEDLEQFICHAFDRSIDSEHLEQMICYHFQIQSFEQLGHGTYSSVINQIKQKHPLKSTWIHYECLMFNELSFLKFQSMSNLDQQALDIINQCPILDNLHFFTQWNRRFRCQLGQLKQFLLRYHLSFLELDHQTLLKLFQHSTIDLFQQSLNQFDTISTVGHLVSLLLQSNTISQAPLALLANIFQTFLYSIELNQRFYQFLKGLLLRIPFLLLTSIIHRIFLEPLFKIEGSQMKIRDRLWQTLDQQDQSQIQKFIQLGDYLGFTDWSNEKIQIEPMEIEKSIPIVVSRSSSIVSEVKSISSEIQPFDLIEQIRREKFGIGLQLSPESEDLTNQLKSLIGRSLEHLSKELYNTNMHFILELIQNADDNHYEINPSLLFVLDEYSINIYNNERGFSQDNIRALCDIGKSTKGKHQQGYIGQKGIGFKSVFTITDRPEIYSNGYRICFNAMNGSIGYILPEWIENERRENEYLNWSTRICLPLKHDRSLQRILIENFNDLHSSILLFLHRLRSIKIENRLISSNKFYQRIDQSNSNLIQILSDKQIEKWFVIKKQIPIPNHIKFDIQSTEIALAFPLTQIVSDRTFQLIKQDVFAYLPIRTYGFTFIIQADFELPSSRQDILNDNLWNQYLLNEIPTLFLSSLESFHSEQSSLPIDALHLFLHFLPNESSVYNNLFTPICRKIRQLLRSLRFLPVINDANLHFPNECIIIHDLTIRELLTPEHLSKYFNLFYLNNDLIEFENDLYDLGVQHMNSSKFISFLTSESFIRNQKDNLSKWFLCLYRYFNQLSIESEYEFFQHIRTLKIFPIQNSHELICLNEQQMFFSTRTFRLSKILENDLIILDDNLWRNSNQIRLFLEKLGLLPLTSKHIYEQHILPIFENEYQWKNKSNEVLVEYICFIYDIWLNEGKSFDHSKLISIVQLLTNDHFQNPSHSSIYFPISYGNSFDLSKDFPDINWIFLDEIYLEKISDRQRLHEFFLQLNIRDFLFPITNQTLEILISLINKQSRKINRKLFLTFQQTWSKDNQLILNYLKESKWIPMIEKKIFGLNQPKYVYIKSKEIEKVFSFHVPYIDFEIDVNSEFVKDLDLIRQVTIDDLLSKLEHWIEQRELSTSICHLENVYEFISENLNRNQIREFIEMKSIFFIPISSFSSSTDVIQGKFVSINEICWSDPTNLFVKYSWQTRYLLELYYPSQKRIFLDIFTVPLYPTIDEYIQLIVHITRLETSKETIDDVFLIFQILGEYFQQIDKQDLQNKLSNKSIFPTKDHRWISLTDHPIISDDDHLAELFSQSYPLSFIDLPSSSSLLRFFQLCDISSLSSLIHIEPILENPTSDSSIQNLLSPLIPYIEMYMKSRSEFTSIYLWTKSIDLSSILFNLEFYLVDNLQLIYRFQTNSSIYLIENQRSYYDSNTNSFYFHRNSLEQIKSYQDIFHSFARIFFPKTNSHSKLIHLLGNFLSLLHNEDKINIENFAKYQEFDLNWNDIQWKISSTNPSIKSFEPKIDENKVRILLETIEQDKQQYQAYKQKKREESNLRLDRIQSESLPSNVEILDEFTKNFDIEDLTRQVLDNRHSTIGSNQQSLEKIGRWGEKWVNEYLHSKYPSNYEIIWLNELFEQGKPYDFILKNVQTQSINYIEVKSTISSHRQLIPITYNEIQYCCSLVNSNEHFQIYRIYNTGQIGKVKLSIVENLEEKLRKHQLELFLLI